MDLHFSITGDEGLTPAVDSSVGAMQRVVDEAAAASRQIDALFASMADTGRFDAAFTQIAEAVLKPRGNLAELNTQLEAVRTRLASLGSAVPPNLDMMFSQALGGFVGRGGESQFFGQRVGPDQVQEIISQLRTQAVLAAGVGGAGSSGGANTAELQAAISAVAGLRTQVQTLDEAAATAGTTMGTLRERIAAVASATGVSTRSPFFEVLVRDATGVEDTLQILRERVAAVRAEISAGGSGPAFTALQNQLITLENQFPKVAISADAAFEKISRMATDTPARAAAAERAIENFGIGFAATAAKADVSIQQILDKLDRIPPDATSALSKIEQLKAAVAANPDARIVRTPDTFSGGSTVTNPDPGETRAATMASIAEQNAEWERLSQTITSVKNAASAPARDEFLAGIDFEVQRANSGFVSLYERIASLRASLDAAPASRGVTAIGTQLDTLDARFQRLAVTAQTSLNRIENMPTATVAQLERASGALTTFGTTLDGSLSKGAIAITGLESKLNSLPAASERATGGLRTLDTEAKSKPGDFEKATTAVGGFLSTLTGFVGGQIAFALLGDLTRGVNAVTKALTDGAIADQSYVATYSNLLGSVGAAVAHVNELRQQATDLPVPTDKLIDADRRMQAALGPGQTFLQHYGETQKDVTRTLADVATARPDINISQVASAIERVSVGAPRASQSIKQLGLSAEELAAAGAQLNRQGTAFLPNRDVENARAVIIALETKYKDMAATHSQTFQGMGQELQNWVSLASSLLGRDVFAEIRTRLREFLDNLKDPAVQATLADWGDKFGRVAHAGFELFDTLVNGAKLAWGAIKPVVDLIGQLLGSLSQSSSAASPFAGITAGASDFTDQMNLGNQAVDQTAQETVALNDAIKRLQDTAQGVRDHYASLIDPLKEQETVLDRIFQRGQEQTQLDKLNKEIARDKALAVDAYSSEGQAASLRLLGEEEQRTNLMGTMRHNEQKANIQDQIKSYESQQKAVESSLQAQERALRAQVDALKAQDNWWTNLPPTQKKVVDSNATVSSSTNTVRLSFDNLLNKIKEVIGPTGIEAFTKAWDGIVTEVNDFPRQAQATLDAIGNMAHALGVDQGLAWAAVAAKWAVITAIEDMAATMGGVGAGVKRFLAETNEGLATLTVGWIFIHDLLAGQEPGKDPAFAKATTDLTVARNNLDRAKAEFNTANQDVNQTFLSNAAVNQGKMERELAQMRAAGSAAAPPYSAANPGPYANYGYGGAGTPGGATGPSGDVMIIPPRGQGASAYNGATAMGLGGGTMNVNVTTSVKCPTCGRTDFQNAVKTDIGFISNALANNYRANNR